MADNAQRPTSVQGVMKQTSKTESERNGPSMADEPTGPNDGARVADVDGVREGDKPLDRSKTGGSSPYEEPRHRAKGQRSE